MRLSNYVAKMISPPGNVTMSSIAYIHCAPTLKRYSVKIRMFLMSCLKDESLI